MKLPQMPQDKANHFAYGAGIAAVGMFWNPFVAFCAVMAFGVGKEMLDLYRGTGKPEGADLAATVFGGMVVLFPYLMGM